MKSIALFSLQILLLTVAGCYSPSIPNGTQQCGSGGACANGYQCGPDNHCYKMGQVPSGTPDMHVAATPDMAITCTDASCKNTELPVCDPSSKECVACLVDGDCASGTICTQKACVPGCNADHGCADGGGMCDPNTKQCVKCTTDAMCGGGEPRCDVANGVCVACLPLNDNCASGKFCGLVNGAYTCQTGCSDVNECPKPDGGAAQVACCNHVCVDTNSDGNNCGKCGTACGPDSCCGGTCSDVKTNLTNCGMCGLACAGQHAMWMCSGAMCGVVSCSAGFGDCDKMASDGCEATLATDPNNCAMCGNKCTGANAMMGCANNACTIASCNAGFGDCDKNPANGCEVPTGSDVNNCGGCGIKCNIANATPTCLASKCAIGMCNNGFTDCNMMAGDGCETSTVANPNNCGGCGLKCAVVPNAVDGCAASKCVITSCTNGFKDCDAIFADGCEVNATNDVNNCGGCGTTCTAGANVTGVSCANSACAITTCAMGFGNCNGTFADGCEINTTSDNNNCGGCGKPCGNGFSCVNSVCTNVYKPKVMLAFGSAGGTTNAVDVQGKQLATGAFTSVDVFDAHAATPTLAQLQAYDVVMAFTDGGGFLDPVTFGNNLASYYDGGGHVVISVFANASIAITGNFGTVANGYMLVNPLGQEEPSDTLGTINEPNTPLVLGVATLTMPTAYRSTGGVVNGGIVVAQFTSGKPLIVRGVIKGRNRCDLNFYTPSQYWTGDGTNIIRNCLLYR